MRTFSIGFGSIGIALFSGTLAFAVDSVDLRPKFKDGQVLHYRNATKIKQGRQMGDQNMEMDISIEAGMRLKVLKANPDGGGEVELSYLYVAMDGGPPGGNMKYDSRTAKADDPNPMGSMLQGVINKPLTLSISSAGAIEKVSGAEALASARMLGSVLSEDAIRQLPLFLGRKAPNPTAQDVQWTDQIEMSQPPLGKITTDFNYVLSGVDTGAKTASITFDSVRKLTPETDGASQFTLDNAKSQGRAVWDLAAGQLVKSSEDSDMTIKMPNPGGDASAGGMTLTVKSNAVVERAELKDFNLPAETPAAAKPAEKEAEKK